MAKLVRKSRKEQLESRVRELRRAIRKSNDKNLRDIYKDHIEYLELQISEL